MAEHHEELLRQPVQEVRAAIRTMSQPNHSNVNAQVYPVFLGAGNLIQGRSRAARKFLAFQTPDKHETNWYFQHKEQDEQVKIEGDTKRSIFV